MCVLFIKSFIPTAEGAGRLPLGIVVKLISRRPLGLIEKLAESIASDCLVFPQVAYAQIRVHKPDAPIEGEFEDVVVTRAKFA